MGLLSLIGVSGLGRLIIRPVRPLVLHWYAALAMLAGFALSSFSVVLLSIVGADRTGFRTLGVAIVCAGLAGHRIGHGRWLRLPMSARAVALFCLAALLPALITLAPSSKIDELYYHMPEGRRVLADHGLRVYQLPAEQTVIPQMGYQISETVFHSVNAPDAGNILGLGFGVVLWFLIYGIVAEESGSADAGLLAALAAAVGVYPAVWYVTAGPHALGDLGTFAAVAALIFPCGLSERTRWWVCALGTVCAASTKISLVPLGLCITLLAIRKGSVWVVALWLLMFGPLVTWAWLHTGSPFGGAFAGWFGPTAYQAVALNAVAVAHTINQSGLRNSLYYAARLLNGGSLVLIAYGFVCCWSRFRMLACLVALQVGLIALFLPHDFRFMGGLQYGLLAVGAIRLKPRSLTFALVLFGPWFAAEAYYARPFVSATLRLTSSDAFLERYVALTKDFRMLDKILPADAVLYAPGVRLPAEYSPRPVVFALADWDRRGPLYRLLMEEAGAPLQCDAAIYRNASAAVMAYRTPKQAPERAAITVQRCRLPDGQR